MSIGARIASSLLVIYSGCVVNVFFSTAFSPSTGFHDAHTRPTAKSYTNGDLPPSPFTNIWDPPSSKQQTSQQNPDMMRSHAGFRMVATISITMMCNAASGLTMESYMEQRAQITTLSMKDITQSCQTSTTRAGQLLM